MLLLMPFFEGASIAMPNDTKGDTLHIICEIHDNGPFHLVANRRIVIAIKW